MFLLPETLFTPVRRNAWIVYALIGANVTVFLATALWGTVGGAAQEFGSIPAHWSPVTLITSQFLHAGWWHLLGNMLFLYLFGEGVEQAVGHWRTLAWYLASGALGDVVRAFVDHGSTVPSIGASGSICGLAGAYAVLFPKEEVRLHFFVLRWHVGSKDVSALVAVSAWLGEQVLLWVLSATTGLFRTIGYGAHAVGLMAGGLIAVEFLARRKRRSSVGMASVDQPTRPCSRCGATMPLVLEGLLRCPTCKRWEMTAAALSDGAVKKGAA